jgi:hypothetical protein
LTSCAEVNDACVAAAAAAFCCCFCCGGCCHCGCPFATPAPRLGLLVLILTVSSSPLLLLLPWLVLSSSPLVLLFALAARSLPIVLPVRPLGSQKRNEHQR